MPQGFLDHLIPIPEYEAGILAESPCYLLKESLVALQQRILWDNSVTSIEEVDNKKMRLLRDVGLFGRCAFSLSVEDASENEVRIREELEPAKSHGYRTYEILWTLKEKGYFTQVDLRLRIDWGPRLLRRYSGAMTFSQWSTRLERLKYCCERKTNWLKSANPHGRI